MSNYLGGIQELLQNVMGKVRNIGQPRELISPIPKSQQLDDTMFGRQGVIPSAPPTPEPRVPQFFEGGQLPGRASVPATPQDLRPTITNAVTNNQMTDKSISWVDELLLSVLLGTESSFNPNAQGYMPAVTTGETAQGIAQFLPSTAQDLYDRGIVNQEFNPLNQEQAIPAAAAMLNDLIQRQVDSGNTQDATASALTRYKGSPNRAQEVLDLIGR